LRQAAARHGVPVVVNQKGGALSVHFTSEPVRDFAAVERSDAQAFARFFREMIAAGVHVAPSIYEAWFVTAAHTEEDSEQALKAADRASAAVDLGRDGPGWAPPGWRTRRARPGAQPSAK